MEAAVQEEQGRTFSGGDVWLRPYDYLQLGDSFVSRARTVTEADVVGFAALTGDWHPQHSDQTYAENSLFGQRVAHGLLVMALAVGLVPNEYVAALRRVKQVVFKAPVVFGDTIHVEGTIVRLVPFSDDMGMVTGRWKVLNQDGAVVMKMELDALWRREQSDNGHAR